MVKIHALLISILDDDEWSTSRSGHITSSEIGPATHWIGGCMGPRAGLDGVVKGLPCLLNMIG